MIRNALRILLVVAAALPRTWEGGAGNRDPACGKRTTKPYRPPRRQRNRHVWE